MIMYSDEHQPDQETIERESLSMLMENEQELRRDDPDFYWKLIGELTDENE